MTGVSVTVARVVVVCVTTNLLVDGSMESRTGDCRWFMSEGLERRRDAEIARRVNTTSVDMLISESGFCEMVAVLDERDVHRLSDVQWFIRT